MDDGYKAYSDRDQLLLELGYANWLEYLASKHWLDIRHAVLSAAKHKCSCCWRKASKIHFLSFGRDVLQGTKNDLLAPLCNKCNNSIAMSGKGFVPNFQDAQRRFATKLAKEFERTHGLRPGRTKHGKPKKPKHAKCVKTGPLAWRTK